MEGTLSQAPGLSGRYHYQRLYCHSLATECVNLRMRLVDYEEF